MVTVQLAQRLKNLRESCNYTQEYVSSKINIERSSYSNYELGKRTPSLDIVIAFANLYHISLDDLLCNPDFSSCAATAETIENIHLSKDEEYLLFHYRRLSEHEKDMVLKRIAKK